MPGRLKPGKPGYCPPGNGIGRGGYGCGGYGCEGRVGYGDGFKDGYGLPEGIVG